MKKLPPFYKTCQNPECGKVYEVDKRSGKKGRENSKTCSVPCQRIWLGKNQMGKPRGVWTTKSPRKPRVSKPKVEKVVEVKTKRSFQDFKEGLARRAAQRKEWDTK